MILKIGLYTPQQQWLHCDPNRVASLMAQHIDEPSGLYLSPTLPTEGDSYRFQPIWDFDDKKNPPHTLTDARNFVHRLTKQGVPLDALIPFASGWKGIHLVSRHWLPPRADWYAVFAHTAQRNWANEFPTLDAGIYKNRGFLRAPWSYHHNAPPPGSPKPWRPRKKPLPWELFWRGTWSEIAAWAQTPLNDSQYADIETLVREALPTEGPTPAFWTPFADRLVLDYRQSTLTRKAIAAAKVIRPRPPRLKGDWAALLDDAGLDYRERKNSHGLYYKLRVCPYCDGKDKAWVTHQGVLRCFRTGCSAHDGIQPHIWAEHLGVHFHEEDEGDESPSILRSAPTEGALSALEASDHLNKALEHLHHLPPTTALLVMTTPGIGKTTHALKHVQRFAGTVIVAAETKQRTQELFEQYAGERAAGGHASGDRRPPDAQLIQGRYENNCPNFQRVQAVGTKGYLPGKVVCPGCPLFPKNAKQTGMAPCQYYQQFSQPKRVTFCTYEQALYLHEADRLDADLIVLDEDPSRAFLQNRKIQLPQLQLQASELPIRRFAHFLQQTLLTAAETEENHAVYRSRLLAELLHLSADQLNLDLPKLLRQVHNCMSNVYDRPGRLANKTPDELSRLPPAYLQDLAFAIAKELSREGEHWNSTLSLHVANGVATLHFYQRFVFSSQTPLVVLDAYGRPDYYQALLNRPVETLEVSAKTHAKVIKVKLATSKRAFRARSDALFQRLDEVLDHYAGRRTLVYTHKAYVADVQRRYPQVAVQHFWSGRGKDEFRDAEVVVLFGTAEPSPQELLDECRALNASDPIPVSLDPLPTDPRHRADERLESLLNMRREEEMAQAAHRLRPVWAEGRPKTVVVMSHLDLPGLPASEVIDPRALQYQRRKDLFADFIADCLDEMGFYFDGLAELAGIVHEKSKTCLELRQRLAGTGSFIGDAISEPVQSSPDGGSLYPANRNAFYRDRGEILKHFELEAENVTFMLTSGGKATIQVWGDALAASAWLGALVSDRVEPQKPFTLEDLLAVCQKESINMAVLLHAPKGSEAYSRLFGDRDPRFTGQEADEKGVFARAGHTIQSRGGVAYCPFNILSVSAPTRSTTTGQWRSSFWKKRSSTCAVTVDARNQ